MTGKAFHGVGVKSRKGCDLGEVIFRVPVQSNAFLLKHHFHIAVSGNKFGLKDNIIRPRKGLFFLVGHPFSSIFRQVMSLRKPLRILERLW